MHKDNEKLELEICKLCGSIYTENVPCDCSDNYDSQD